jgi:hypothetical protein
MPPLAAGPSGCECRRVAADDTQPWPGGAHSFPDNEHTSVWPSTSTQAPTRSVARPQFVTRRLGEVPRHLS